MSAGGGVGVSSGSGGSSGGVDMPGSFVPTVTAITSSQDLQWMVQPTLISSQASGQSGMGTSTMTQSVSLVDPYDLPGPSYSSGSGFTPAGSDTPGPAPGPIRQSRTRSRRVRDESVSDDGDVGVFVSVCMPCVSIFICQMDRQQELTHSPHFVNDTVFDETSIYLLF